MVVTELLEARSPSGEEVVGHLHQGIVQARSVDQPAADALVEFGKAGPEGFLESVGHEEHRLLPSQLPALRLEADLLVDGLQPDRQASGGEVLGTEEPHHGWHHVGSAPARIEKQAQGRPSRLPVHGEERLGRHHQQPPGHLPPVRRPATHLGDHRLHPGLEVAPIPDPLQQVPIPGQQLQAGHAGGQDVRQQVGGLQVVRAQIDHLDHPSLLVQPHPQLGPSGRLQHVDLRVHDSRLLQELELAVEDRDVVVIEPHDHARLDRQAVALDLLDVPYDVGPIVLRLVDFDEALDVRRLDADVQPEEVCVGQGLQELVVLGHVEGDLGEEADRAAERPIQRDELLQQGLGVTGVADEVVVTQEDALRTPSLQGVDLLEDLFDRLVPRLPAVDVDHVAELAVERAAPRGLHAAHVVAVDVDLVPAGQRRVGHIHLADLAVLGPVAAGSPLVDESRPRVFRLAYEQDVEVVAIELGRSRHAGPSHGGHEATLSHEPPQLPCPLDVGLVTGDSDQVVGLLEVGVERDRAVHTLVPDVHFDVVRRQGSHRRQAQRHQHAGSPPQRSPEGIRRSS